MKLRPGSNVRNFFSEVFQVCWNWRRLQGEASWDCYNCGMPFWEMFRGAGRDWQWVGRGRGWRLPPLELFVFQKSKETARRKMMPQHLLRSSARVISATTTLSKWWRKSMRLQQPRVRKLNLTNGNKLINSFFIQRRKVLTKSSGQIKMETEDPVQRLVTRLRSSRRSWASLRPWWSLKCNAGVENSISLPLNLKNATPQQALVMETDFVIFIFIITLNCYNKIM